MEKELEGKPLEKTDKGPGAKTSERRKAWRIYLDHRGNITWQEIADKLDVTRQSVSKWAKQEKWKDRVAQIQKDADAKATTKLGESLAMKVGFHYEADLEFFKICDQLLSNKLLMRGADGKPMRNASGQYVLSDSLSVLEIKNIISARAEKLKAVRLIHGEPTEHGKVSGSMQVDHSHGFDPEASRLFEDAIRNAGSDAQKGLLALLSVAGDMRESKKAEEETGSS